jgi:hypothetical protein
LTPLNNCQWCGQPLPSNAWKVHKECREIANLAAREAKGRITRDNPPVLSEDDKILQRDVHDSECYHCELLHDCRKIAKTGRPVLCQPEGVAPIPVVGFEAPSIFDGLRLGAWREEVER